ncbi:adenylate/guanylate cyclase domain-containing protein [Microvirga puerhi]|uniref:Adenylate/guanylate cyclase domain-containing protein n=1 Tax=Microvirga puerhi TaxID=2876078 RepID=A0ABS7VU71_9HYPH|nr:adenylate/guanylate cyclase domain-containing protein [Microvirga puerhi]MBZ6078655.1 adenylate/guanylate cyclase domain-containing protein [Microvirga puerhi]
MSQAGRKTFLWSLQAVVALVFTVIVLLISGALIGFNHHQLTTLTFRDAEEDFSRITDSVRNEISGSLRVASSVLDTMSLTVDPNLSIGQLAIILTPVLKDLGRLLPAAMGVFIGRGDGSHILVQTLDGGFPPELGTGPDLKSAVLAYMLVQPTTTGETVEWVAVDSDGRELRRVPARPTDFDPRRRPWYTASQASQGIILTPPYRFANVPEAGVTMARQSRQRPDAVFGIDMTLASLDQYLERLRFPPDLELIVFDRSGALIAHPRGAALRQFSRADLSNQLLTIDDLKLPLLSGLFHAFQDSGNGAGRNLSFNVGGDAYFGRTEQVGEGFDNLIIGIAIPYDTMMGPAEQIRSILLLVSAVSVIAALIIVLLASRRLALPLRTATDDIRRIMKFEFGHARRIPSQIVEVLELSRAIDTLELALSNFMRYVPTALVRGIIGRRFSSELGGIRQPITVLFSDVAGFTTMAEALDPEQVMNKTSRYFSEIGSELIRSGATIDKYIGDSIMAFWNAPEMREDHVALACLGALRASRRLDRLNAEFIAEGGAPMRTRFGLHTGEAVVGNVGSVDRMNYTVLGHTVNMASRFEKLNKRYGTTILVSEDVRGAAGTNFLFRFVDKTIPEGAHAEIAVYELLGADVPDEPELAASQERLNTLPFWNEALVLCEAGEWGRAAETLEELVATAPEDTLFKVQLQRCRIHAQTSRIP